MMTSIDQAIPRIVEEDEGDKVAIFEPQSAPNFIFDTIVPGTRNILKSIGTIFESLACSGPLARPAAAPGLLVGGGAARGWAS